MDQLPLPGSGPKAATAAPFFAAMDHTASMSTLPPGAVQDQPFPATEPCRMYIAMDHTIKAKIMSHPLYPALLRAYIDCRKVGAPPEVVGRLSSLADELKPNSDETQEQPTDPALDQFMETYRAVLVAYSQELTRQIQESNEFFRSMEAHIDSFALDDNGCDLSPEDEQETGTGDVVGLPLPITSPSCEGKELTNQLLDKYSGYLRSLWRELSERKKNGRLPRYARQKLLRWWQLHHGWPYPSELEKHALAESTGLDAKQINNWFINQRKRHWNPAPLTMGVDNSYQHISGASSSSPADLRTDEQCFTATGPSGYPD